VNPFVQGALAGYGIALPVGAIAVLILDTALRSGLRQGLAAGTGAAAADGIYALMAVLAGAAMSGWLEPRALWVAVGGGLILIGLGLRGLLGMRREARLPAKEVGSSPGGWATFGKFLALTLLNPLTVVYFSALVLGGQVSGATGRAAGWMFVLGAFLASLSWQSMLAVLGSTAGGRMSLRQRQVMSVIGNVIVLALGTRLLVQVWAGA
jgi:arginine exporter protein ArgO